MVDHTIVPNRSVCTASNSSYEWVESSVNFNNVFNAMVALFQVVSGIEKQNFINI